MKGPGAASGLRRDRQAVLVDLVIQSHAADAKLGGGPQRFPPFRLSTSAIRPISARALDVASAVELAIRPAPPGRPIDGEASAAVRGWNDSGRSSSRMTGPSQRA